MLSRALHFRYCLLPPYSRSDLAEEVAGVAGAEDTVSVGLAQVLLHANVVLGLVGLDVGLTEKKKVEKGAAKWNH